MHYIWKHVRAFTLVELIVVITIVGILSTVGFVSYSWYLKWARDSNRISQVVKLSDSLQVYSTTKSLPIPDDSVKIYWSWVLIWYQWYAGSDVLETIDYTNWGKDPKDDSYFTYYVSKDRKNIQLLTFMEEADSWTLAYKDIFSTNVVFSDFSSRFPAVYWENLWVIIREEWNIPLQDISFPDSSVELNDTSENYKLYFRNNDILSAQWYTLYALTASRAWKEWIKDCPDWFIGVPGNIELEQNSFCVSQYEMTYNDADTPNSILWWTDFNTVSYVPWKALVSMEGKYPVADISQSGAISECQNLWDGYHLITEKEWMTIARNIESVSSNWSGNNVWVGVIYTWITNDPTLWCDDATWWNTETRTYATRTWPWADTDCNSRRKLTLSNKKTIWDFSWNVWEHVNKSNNYDGEDFNTWQTTIPSANLAYFNWDDDGIYGTSEMRIYWPATALGEAVGLWNIHMSTGRANNVFTRGWSARSVGRAWIYTLTLNNADNFVDRYTWFRCVKSY